MSESIRVLHVDDDPSFGGLVSDFLERKNDTIDVVSKTSAANGLTFLEEQQPDCIVSDYDMPGKNGIEFLETVREKYPDLPFILYTGKGSEEVAADAISRGVTDYIQKESGTDQYTVLANRIANAVESHRSQQLLAERDQDLRRYERMINSMQEAACIYNEHGRFELVNEYLAEWYGTTREALRGESSNLIGHVREQAVDTDPYEELLDGQREQIYGELTSEFPGHGYAVLEYRLTPLIVNGSVEGVVGVARDITERKERTRELERARDLLDQTESIADVGGWEIDTDTMDVFWTENLFELLGVDYDEEPPLEEALDVYHEEDRPIVENAVEMALTSGESFDEEVRFHRPDGELRWLRVQGTPTTEEENVVALRGTVQDITDQVQLEQDLRHERDLVTGIVETSPVGIAVITAEGDISFVNDRAETIYGRSREEVEEMTHNDSRWDLINEDGEPLDAGEAPFDRVISRETAIRDHVVGIRRSSGERVWLSVNGAPQWNADGEFERAVFAFEDITDRVELEAELEEILGRVSDAFFALNDELRFTHVNGEAEELLEASEEQLVGETLWDMYPEAAETDEIWDSFQKAMDTQEPQSYELYYEPLEFWVEATVYPSESGLSVYFRDITERKGREEEIEREKRRFQTIFEQSNDAIFLLDPENDAIEDVNPQAEELLGYTRDEFVSSVAISDVHPEQTDQYRDFLDRVQAEGSGRTDRFGCVSKGGDKRDCEISAASLDIEESQLLITNVRDVTERKEYKERLERQNERLEEFASVVSHDLRNPLSVARGGLELVREDCESEQFDSIEHAHNRMHGLIEDLLTLAREGNVVTDTEAVELSEMVARCWENVETDNASLVMETNQTILADKSRLKQVFENLMRNAIEHGGDTVTVTVGGLDDGFYIEDDGSGIPPSDRDDVFEAGYSTNADGTGFGLRITEQIVEAHDWAIDLTEGTEARFEITACGFAAD